VGKGAFGKVCEGMLIREVVTHQILQVRIVERKDTGLTFALKYIRKDEGTHQPLSYLRISLYVYSRQI